MYNHKVITYQHTYIRTVYHILSSYYDYVSSYHHTKMLNATFNNISAISWRSGLLVEETGVPGESHRLVASNCIKIITSRQCIIM